MENLSIIITGEIRSFFSNNYFTEVLNKCIENYNQILVICVVNSKNMNEYNSLNLFFKKFKIHNSIIINYADEKYQIEFNEKMREKYNNPNFIKIRQKYMELNTNAHKEINDPYTNQHNVETPQLHQISIGIKKMIEYQNKANIFFDVVFKTRFDVKYPCLFYPSIQKSNNIIDILTHNKINKEFIVNSMKKYNLKTIHDLIEFNKQNKIVLPNCRVDRDHFNISFGGPLFYNYITLEKVLNNTENILYSYNDHFYFANNLTFCKIDSFFDNAFILDEFIPELLYHIYCPETQLINCALHSDIKIIVYYNDSWNIRC
jgi:hypothetical protein